MSSFSSSFNPHGLRLLGKSISLLAVTGLLAYGCERGQSSGGNPPPSPAPKQSPAMPKTEATRTTEKPNPAASTAQPAKPSADVTKIADFTPGDRPKSADGAKSDDAKPATDGAPAAPTPKPIPHADLPADVKAPSEFNVPMGAVVQEFKKGEGFPTLPKAVVTMHYVLHVKDGWKKIQSTYDDGAAVTYQFDELVEGMADGIAGMLPGGMRRIIVPPERGFGAKGAKDKDGKVIIPPGATLVYDVDLISNKQTVIDAGPPKAVVPKFNAGRKDAADDGAKK
jgi:hypothetical protein